MSDTVLEGRRRLQALRRPAGAVRRGHRDPARPGLRPDRPQRGRQDHLLQRADRALHARQRAASSSAASPTSRARCTRWRKAGIARTFQNIRLFAEMTALENVMVGRHVRTHSGLIGAVFRTRSFKRRRGGRSPQRAQELLDYVGIGKFCRLQGAHAELRRPAPAGDRARAGDRPEADRAGRARRRHERHREGGAARADRPHPQGRPHHPADRARREAGDGPVRPRHRARLRQADRRGHAARRAAQREGDRGLPRRRPQAH